MASNLPASRDSFSTSHQDGVNEKIFAATINDLDDAMNKLEAMVGAQKEVTALRPWYSLRDYVTVYGTATAAATGTDGTAGVNQAITDANAAGGGIVLVPGWVRISGQVTLKSNVTLYGLSKMNVGFVVDDTSASIPFVAAGTSPSNSALSSGTLVGDRTATVTSGTSFLVGEWVLLYNGTTSMGWISRVLSKATNVLTFEERMPLGFAITTTSAYRLSMVANVTVANMTIRTTTGNAQSMTTRLNGALRFFNTLDCSVENCYILGFASDAVSPTNGNGVLLFHQSRNSRVENCLFEKNGDANPAPAQVTQVLYWAGGSTQIVCSGNTVRRNGSSSSISFENSCHISCVGNVIGGMSSWATYTGGSATDSGGRGIKLWQNCVFWTITGNVIHDSGFDAIHPQSSRFGTIANNEIFGPHDYCINFSNDSTGIASDVAITGNLFGYPSADVGSLHGINLQGAAAGGVDAVTITGNVFNTPAQTAIYGLNAQNCVIAENIIKTTTSYGIRLDTGCTRNSVHGNTIRSSNTNSINSASSAGSNWVWGNLVDLAVAVKTTATSDWTNLARSSTASPGDNFVI